MSIIDQNVNIARLQAAIIDCLGMEQVNVVFNYQDNSGIVKLDLVTINPVHEQSFLLHSIKAINKVEALEKMQAYIIEHYKEENSYTIQWTKIGESDLHTSYFRAQNIYQVLDKFTYGRDRNAYKIFSINMNPIS